MNTTVEPMGKLLNYRISEKLYAGSRTLVYRAIREADQLPVVIKLLQQDYPTFNELLLFRNQYTIAKNIDLPGIVHPYSLEPYRNSYALIMEDFGGISLRDWMNTRMESNQYPLTEFLDIAIALSNILDELYRHRVIHKDIKPANILINPETKQVKLIDFSIASLLPRESREIHSPNVLEGTLAYLSPEQTGRMNRKIDYRSDYYSLGITFYELLTGQLPFQSNDPMELVHSHIAKQAEQLGDRREEEIPQVLCDIVMKLMAKNAEDRYQSALGLKFDLEQCLEQLKNTGRIKSFPIAQRDICDRFIIPEKLYGRQAEVQSLLDAFEKVNQGSTEIMLVAGFSGIGKTAVVNEIHKPIVRQRGYFIKGKFDQFGRNIPFSAFVQAFRDLIKQLLSETDGQFEQWKCKILSALGENRQVMIEVIPELESMIGKQPPALELSGSAAQNRFNMLFLKFTQVFTAPEHPLVIFIDDLQWADSASLKLMHLLMSEADIGYLLLIGAYRDNEVNPVHPLMLTLEEIQKLGATVNTITLAPLDQTSVNHLVADTLSCSLTLAAPLTEESWQAHYQLTFELSREFAECEYLTSNFNQAETLFNLALNHSQDKFEKSGIYAIKMYLKMTHGENIEASIESGLKGLSIMGMHLPVTSEEQQAAIETEVQELTAKLATIHTADLFNLPAMTDPEKKVIADPYIIRQQPKSLLCTPILYQGKLLGILYLENNLTTGAFTSDRVEILNLLCTQAAISLENAQLYQQAQDTLKNLGQTEQFLRLIIDNILQSVFWKDRNCVYLGCNQKFAQTTGVGVPENIIGKTDYDLSWTDEQSDWYVECDRRIIESGQAELNIIETLQQADGKQIWSNTNKIPLRDKEGNVFGILGTCEDITEPKEAQQLLQQQKQQLEEALQELQTMQLQLVQGEKMSALGNLVAGVAHEINNPVGFIAGNIEPAKDYIKDLFGLINLYQQKFPDPGSDIEDEIDGIDLDYLREDLPKLLDSMKLGVNRIRSISTSLRTFSRADKDYKVPFNIHEGIDSTILILRHRLKANENRPEIVVLKDYGKLPLVECFAGQINQVFMNLLANAIDALEEYNTKRSLEAILANPNCITIQTSVA
ncbi:AAA family ATPase [Nostoc sp. CHAB 5714]|uniref:AAA family ATPase n=1 Tax=Nostoc favosum CHAB5714 TaxID=2780399 RepID=A0ABS8IG59_9NOSO|nr:AAA family ATPase [Nostoc favosum]MCC5603078.1 AAA family ATPase [Nostoc favosum CHAB5714]